MLRGSCLCGSVRYEVRFDRYVETYDEPDTSDRYFGWLCNYLPYYESTFALKTRVHPRDGAEVAMHRVKRAPTPG